MSNSKETIMKAQIWSPNEMRVTFGEDKYTGVDVHLQI